MDDEQRARILDEARELLARSPEPYVPPPEPSRSRSCDPIADDDDDDELPPQRLDTAPPVVDPWANWEAWMQARLDAAITKERRLVCRIMAQVIAAERQAAAQAMRDQAQTLRAEFAHVQRAFENLREVIAAERARVLDLPPLPRRTEMN